MSTLCFLPLGVGDAFSARYYSSSLAIQADGAWLLLDCPHPIRKMMKEASVRAGIRLDLDQLLATAVTHLHADHCSGLEGLGFYSHFILKRPAHLIMHPLVADRLWEGHLAAGMAQLTDAHTGVTQDFVQDAFFRVTTFTPEQPVQVGPFRLECRRTHHHIPTTAFRISAGGRTLGVSADTSFDPELIDWLAQADLFIHETNYGIHTPYAQLAGLPEPLRQKMRLTHYPDDFPREASLIEPLEEGRLYTV